jgi:hypothetical protein
VCKESAGENYVSDSGPGPNIDGFSTKDCKPSIPIFTGNLEVQFVVQNGTDVMGCVDNYISPELIEIVVDQTNLYTQQLITTRY